MNRAKELAEAHWSYIERLLDTHTESRSNIDMVKFHYISSFVHGYGHGAEDTVNGPIVKVITSAD